jgi:hypothetical protein
MLKDESGSHRFDAFVSETASMIGGGLATLSVLANSFRIDDFVTNMMKARRGVDSNDFLRLLT